MKSCCHWVAVEQQGVAGFAGFVEEAAVVGATEAPNDCLMGTTTVAVAAAIFGEAGVAGSALKNSVVMSAVFAVFGLNFAAASVVELDA